MYISLHQGHVHIPILPNPDIQESNHLQSLPPPLHRPKPIFPCFSSLLSEGQLSKQWDRKSEGKQARDCVNRRLLKSSLHITLAMGNLCYGIFKQLHYFRVYFSTKTLFGWCLKAPIRFDKHYSIEENLNIIVCYLLLPLQAGPEMGDQFLFGWWQQNCYHYQNKPANTQVWLRYLVKSSEIKLFLLWQHNTDRILDQRKVKINTYKRKYFLPYSSGQWFFWLFHQPAVFQLQP